MNLIIQELISNPLVKSTAVSVLTELTEKGLWGMYDSFMDTLAYRIAKYSIELESKEKEMEKENV